MSFFFLTKFSSLGGMEVIKVTIFNAASDDNFVKITFSFQWDTNIQLMGLLSFLLWLNHEFLL